MIKLIKSSFLYEEETKKRLCDFISEAKMLSMSEQCSKFEKKFSEKQKRKHSVFVNSGSSANLLLIQSLINIGVFKKGDIIGVSALTWATNIMPLIQLGLQPFLIDCEIESLNVSSKTLLNALNKQPNIKGFFITNTLGLSDDISNIEKICKEKKIVLLEDNCEALGSVVDGRLLGNFGFASTFSFFVGHHISTIEGGMICTDDNNLYEALVISRSHGWDRHLSEERQNSLREKYQVDDFFAKYTFYDLGYNIRPTEINGFLGNTQIEYWDFIAKKRYDNFLFLNEAIKKNNKLIPISFNHMDLVSSFAIPVIAKNREITEEYKSIFIKNDVEIRPMIAGNMAKQPFYLKYISNPGIQENADYIHKNSFYFGNNPELTEEELILLKNILS